MAAVIGWYGPLIDLCKASAHIGSYVQILVFVHKCNPIQYKVARTGGEVVRTDILVGDETRTYFPVTIWQKQLASKVVAGDVVLFQNVKITRFSDAVEARTVQFSYLQCLVKPDGSLATKVVDGLLGECDVGITTKNKLHKVIRWVQKARLAHCDAEWNHYKLRRQLEVNWKVHEEKQSQDCLSLSDICNLMTSCKVIFRASVGEIFLPITWRHLRESEVERMFISRRLHTLGDDSFIDDLISTGCYLCGTPVNPTTRSNMESIPLYCQKSSNHFHALGTIYRPFMLYVWDNSRCIPLLVTNKAAEMLFGHVQAEKVYSCYRSLGLLHVVGQGGGVPKENHSREVKMSISTISGQETSNPCSSTAAEKETSNPCLSSSKRNLEMKARRTDYQRTNFYKIWLILLSTLLHHGRNSPLKFKVAVDTSRDIEDGRFEMLSVSMPS